VGIGVGKGVAVGTGVAVGGGVGTGVGDGVGVAVGGGAIVGVGCTAVGDGSTTTCSVASLPQAMAAIRMIAMGTARNFLAISRTPYVLAGNERCALETAPVYQMGLDMNRSNLM
jgi:hypothetical protein